jgi:hypothetical protein
MSVADISHSWPICLGSLWPIVYIRHMTKSLTRPIKDLAREINQLHREIGTILQTSILKAIRAGELLVELKPRVGHGNWRTWVERNLSCSMRTCSRYMKIYWHRDKLSDTKSLNEAESLLTHKEHGFDAGGADYRRIRKDLVSPITTVRRRLQKLEYVGDSAEAVDSILAELREEVAALLEELQA